MTHGQQPVRAQHARIPGAAKVEEIARWWTSATEEERYALYCRSFFENKPAYETLRLAIYLAEVTAGEVAEG